MPLDVELRRLKVVLLVAIQTTGVTSIELSGVRIVVACRALSRCGGISAYACLFLDGMTCGTINSLMRPSQRIDFRMLGTVKSGGGEMALFMTVEASRVSLVKLTSVRIFMATDAGVGPARVVRRIRVGVTLCIGQSAGMALLAGHSFVRGLQGETR